MPVAGEQTKPASSGVATRSSADDVRSAISYVRANRPRFISELQELVRFQSVSAQSQHAGDIRKCADWLVSHLRRIGFANARMVATSGHPVVAASRRDVPERPTVLFYAHYDVQPADPLSEWETPPFESVVRGDYLYGRGTTDNKGPLLAQIKALEAILHTVGSLPVNVICVFDGEEEVGSVHLESFMRRNLDALRADAAVIADTLMLAPDRPTLTYGLRGGVSLEVEVQGPANDLHSGTYGGAVHNPIQALCEIIAALHDETGRVAAPGFYSRVRRTSEEERTALRAVSPDRESVLRSAGVPHSWGDRSYTVHERTTIRPALTINGITGGYQGEGGKGIIPSRATAKLSARLVPDQDPQEIGTLLEWFIRSKLPATAQASIKISPGAQPVLLDRRQPALHAAVRACSQTFGNAPVWIRSGGSIPAVSLMREHLGLTPILMGLSLAEERRHAPNERFLLPNYHRGIEAFIRFLYAM